MTLFAQAHDVLWQAVVAALLAAFLGWLQYRTQQEVRRSAEAARATGEAAALQVAQVKVTAQVVAAKVERTARAVAAKTEQAVEQLTVKAEEVKAALADQAGVTAATHALVNGAALERLRKYAEACRRLADLTGGADDVEAALRAGRDLAEQEARGQGAAQEEP
jgi:hypothetical protein